MIYRFEESDRSLEIDSDGTWHIGSGNGKVELHPCNGQVVVHSGNGQVIVRPRNGQVIVHTGSGQLIVDGRVVGSFLSAETNKNSKCPHEPRCLCG